MRSLSDRVGIAARGGLAAQQSEIPGWFDCEWSNARDEGLQSQVFVVSPPGYDPGTL